MEEKIKKKTKENISKTAGSLIVVIRISGEVGMKPHVNNTLYRMGLRRKYSCILINSSNKASMGMLKKVRFNTAFGTINKEALSNLIKIRGRNIENKKFDSDKIADELINGKSLKELGFKSFFRLHPPRKGINSKLQYPQGVLGNNHENINKLVERML